MGIAVSDPVLSPIAAKVEAGERLSHDDALALFETPDLLGVGALAEKPELLGAIILLVAIPETMVILGFAAAAMILLLSGGGG